MLTRKQHELLMLIHARLQEEGIPPSFDEMKDALSLKSKSGIHRLITALEERGFIRRLPNRARALEVIKLPDGYDTARSAASGVAAGPAKGFGVIEGGLSETNAHPASGRNNVTEVAFGERRGGIAARFRSSGESAAAGGGLEEESAAGFEVPVMGRIAAGVPIEAIQHKTHSISVPPEMLSGGEHYALEVKGDSMIDAGIFDGDTVVIRNTQTANPGEIVVALVDDEEATLKRFRRKGASIALEAANPAYETRIFGPDRVKVQGRLVGLIRRY